MPSEAEFTGQILQLAKLCGWRTFHVRPGRTLRGWRTAVQGDGKGFPDALLVRGDRLLVAELKVGANHPTPEQLAWLQCFRAAGVPAFVWTPDSWQEIEDVLR